MTYHIMTEQEKEEISGWQYPGEYEIYNMPPYAQQKEKGIGLGNPLRSKNFYSYWDGDVLAGFTNILEEPQAVFIGIGVAPNLCGKGYGQAILGLASEIAESLYPCKPLYLEVRTWNERALRCYEKAGFQKVGEPFEQDTLSGKGLFYRMVKGPKEV